jgi:hypothetical protein
MSIFFVGLAVFAGTCLFIFVTSLLVGGGKEIESIAKVHAFMSLVSLLGIGVSGSLNVTMGCVWFISVLVFKHLNAETINRTICLYIDAFIVASIVSFFFLGGQ